MHFMLAQRRSANHEHSRGNRLIPRYFPGLSLLTQMSNFLRYCSLIMPFVTAHAQINQDGNTINLSAPRLVSHANIAHADSPSKHAFYLNSVSGARNQEPTLYTILSDAHNSRGTQGIKSLAFEDRLQKPRLPSPVCGLETNSS